MQNKKLCVSVILLLAIGSSHGFLDNFFSKFLPTQVDFSSKFGEGMKAFQEGMETLKKSMNKLSREFDEIKNKNFSSEQTAGIILDENDRNRRFNLGGCNCENYKCSCCSHLEVDKINLNATACLNITYIPEEVGMCVTFNINGKVLYNNTVSVANPPPICVEVPYLKDAASVCIKFYKLSIASKSLSGCADLVAKLVDVEVARIKLGCFHMNKNAKYLEQLVVSVHSNNSEPKYYNELNHDSEAIFIRKIIINNNQVQSPLMFSRSVLPGKALTLNSTVLRTKRN